MTDNELLTVATQLYVRLRRNGGRIIDVIWAVRNADYAREVLRIAREHPDADVAPLADRFEALAFGKQRRGTRASATASAKTFDDGETLGLPSRYVGVLR